MKPEHVANGIMAYAEAELLPALDGWRLFAAGTALVLARQRIDALVAELANNKMITVLGLIDADGMIILDPAIGACKEVVRKQGKLEIDIPVLGKFTLRETDFDKLHEHIKIAAGQ